MDKFVLSLLVSFLATMGLISFYKLIAVIHASTLDPVPVLGAFLTQGKKFTYPAGVFLHVLGGIFFGLLYIFMFQMLPLPDWGHYTFVYAVVGMAMGFNHGMLDTLIFSIVLTRFHPLEQFRKRGLEIAIVHGVALIPYGFLIGVLYKVLLAF